MTNTPYTENSNAENAGQLANQAQKLAEQLSNYAADSGLQANLMETIGSGHSFFMMGLTIFILACFVGYYVVWRVTPALHSPLMGVTNAISSVIIVGAIIAAGPMEGGFAKVLGFLGIVLASINIFGGFIITQRMLSMFKKKESK